MKTLTSQILEYAGGLPEGMPISPKGLLHLGSRAAVDQSLSRLARRGLLLRAGRGVYVRPIESRFGVRTPAAEKVITAIAKLRGELIAPSGATAANNLGLTTQVPMRLVFLTSGPSRRIQLGAQTLEMKHAPRWQLIHVGEPAGEAVRALAWLGPTQAKEGLTQLKQHLPSAVLEQIAEARAGYPGWLAKTVSTELVASG